MWRTIRELWKTFRDFGGQEFEMIEKQKQMLRETARTLREAKHAEASQISTMITDMAKNMEKLKEVAAAMQKDQVQYFSFLQHCSPDVAGIGEGKDREPAEEHASSYSQDERVGNRGNCDCSVTIVPWC